MRPPRHLRAAGAQRRAIPGIVGVSVSSFLDVERIVRERAGPRALVVVGVDSVRRAGRMLAALVPLQKHYGWKVKGLQELQAVTSLYRAMRLVDRVDVPRLLLHASDAVAIANLTYRGFRVRAFGRRAGGSIEAPATALGNRLRRIARRAADGGRGIARRLRSVLAHIEVVCNLAADFLVPPPARTSP